MLVLPLVLLQGFLVRCSPTHRPIGKTSRGFWRCFAFLSTQGFRTLNHVDDFFLRWYVMHRFVLCERCCWLRWLSLSFSVYLFCPLLFALPATLGHSDTLGACPCWNWMVLMCHFRQLPLLFSIRRLIVKKNPLL
jgi:hypothetical protein